MTVVGPLWCSCFVLCYEYYCEFDDRCGVHSRPNHPCAVIRGVGMHASGMVREYMYMYM